MGETEDGRLRIEDGEAEVVAVWAFTEEGKTDMGRVKSNRANIILRTNEVSEKLP